MLACAEDLTNNADDLATTLADIAANGGEAMIVDAQNRIHYVEIDDDGIIGRHLRYEGDPASTLTALIDALARGEDPAELVIA